LFLCIICASCGVNEQNDPQNEILKNNQQAIKLPHDAQIIHKNNQQAIKLPHDAQIIHKNNQQAINLPHDAQIIHENSCGRLIAC
jgi:virulence-associated protein VagC